MTNNESMKGYIQEIRKIQLLTAKEEENLAKRIVENDETARNELTEANLRLVVFIANQYKGLGISLDDLIQEGNMGLIKAVELYDYRRGIRFASYAVFWIRKFILKALAEQSGQIRKSAHTVEMIRKIRQTSGVLEQELGRMPSDQEIADRMKKSLNNIRTIQRTSQQTVSLDEPVGEDDSSLKDFLEDQETADPYKMAEKSMITTGVKKMLEFLTQEEREIICRNYGISYDSVEAEQETIDASKEKKAEERRIEERAITKLYNLGMAWEIKDFLE